MSVVKILSDDTTTYESFKNNKQIVIKGKSDNYIDEKTNKEYFILEFENAKPKKVFLGGSVFKSKWREEIIPKLKINYFNPVVKNWDQDAQDREEMEKENTDFRLYVITNINSAWSIAEAIDDANNRPEGLLFCIHRENLPNGKLNIDNRSMKNLNKVKYLIKIRGGKVFDTLDEVVEYLNSFEI